MGNRTPSPTRPRGDAEDRALVPRDQWGRYLMHHLDGTKPAKNKGFTRVSTTKSALSNQEGIRKWGEGLIVDGLGQDDRLIQEAIGLQKIIDPEQRKKAGRDLAQRAFIKGGGKDRSGRGTAFHEVTEQLNGGKIDYETAMTKLTGDDAESLRRYWECLQINNIQPIPDMLERQVLCPYNQGGTFDNMFRVWNPDTEEWELLIGDLKTGRTIDLAALEILIQLWSYANAYGIWTTTKLVMSEDGSEVLDFDGFYEPMPRELRQDKAVIIHVPLDGTAVAYILDLGGVEEAVKAAVTAKRWNAEAKHKFRRMETAAAPTFVAPEVAPPAPSGLDEFSDPGRTYPTADAQLQADTAAARLAAVNQLAQAEGRNDDPDDGDPVTVASVDHGPAAAVTAKTDGIYVLDGEGNPLGPLADRSKKERGCGVCGRKGHKAKSPKCLGDLDPAKTGIVVEQQVQPDGSIMAVPTIPKQSTQDGLSVATVEEAAAVRPTTAEIEAFVNAAESPPEMATDAEMAAPVSDTAQATVLAAVADLPYCPLAHQHDIYNADTGGGQNWLCRATGKPTREFYEKHGSGVPRAEPVAPPAAWAGVQQPDLVAFHITNATTQQGLLTHRQRCIEAGTWSAEYDTQAMAKYVTLPS